MAEIQADGLIQDQNLNAHHNEASVGGKTNVSEAQKKGRLGGRKPLINKVASASGKTNVSKAKKKGGLGGRKNHKKNLNAVVEEQLSPHDIAEEPFYYGRLECFEARKQAEALDMYYFLKEFYCIGNEG